MVEINMHVARKYQHSKCLAHQNTDIYYTPQSAAVVLPTLPTMTLSLVLQLNNTS
jgi:hypothetical protein